VTFLSYRKVIIYVMVETRTVSVYLHETGETLDLTCTVADVLRAMRTHRPRRRADASRTFCIGSRPEYIAFTTTGPDGFIGQHPIWDGDKLEGAMRFPGLSWRDVVIAVRTFYASRRGETCFAPYNGTFCFYRPS
jgi:hypothetical protein